MTEPVLNIDLGNIFEAEKILESDIAEDIVLPEETPLEKALSKVDAKDAKAVTVSEAKFQFRDLLDENQRKGLALQAPRVSQAMVANPSEIINFGAPVLNRLNDMSKEVLAANKDIKMPEADQLVNNLLSELDGYKKKHKNAQVEKTVGWFTKWVKGARHSLETMIRDAKPIEEKLEMAEGKLRSAELELERNVERATELAKRNDESLQKISGVLAALEEVIEVTRAEHKALSDAIAAADPDGVHEVARVEYKGEVKTTHELKAELTRYSDAISQMEQSWLDWRSQFFLGYGRAPSVTNIAAVSTAVQRRVQVFRTQGIPSARFALAQMQTALVARNAAETGDAMREATNKMIQTSVEKTADAVVYVANASQTPMLDEKTVLAVVDSITKQCRGLVEANARGQQLREANLRAIEKGETVIKAEFDSSREKIAQQTIAHAKGEPVDVGHVDAKVANDDILSGLID